MARGISFVALFVAAAAACVGEDPKTTPPPAPEAGAGSVNNLLANGGFQNGCGAPFFSSNAALAPETATSRTGGKACKVCKTPGPERGYYVYAYVDDAPKEGDVYTVSAWMRKVLAVEPGTDAQIAVVAIDETSSAIDGFGQSKNAPAVIDEWTEAKLTWTVGAPGATAPEKIRLDLGLAAADEGNCFIVDDFVVEKQTK